MKNHKKSPILTSIIALILLFCSTMQAQVTRAKGLIFDPIKYQQSAKNHDTRGNVLRELPTRLSLRPFCPTPQDQGSEPSCTAWAIAYGAITIQQAILRKATNTNDVDKIACSKSFVFNQINQMAGEIPTIEATFDFLKKNGTCLTTTFHNGLPITTKPDDLAIKEAQSRRLLKVTEVYNPDANLKKQRQIQRFKHLLADSMPIVVGVRLPYSFSNLTNKIFKYDPTEPIDSAAHALCLIGYDDLDSTFECMNSWGTSWGGDQGFVRLRYSDMFALLCCAYQITPRFLAEKKGINTSVGSVVLRKNVGYNNQHLPEFEEIRVQYDSLRQYYQTQQNWSQGSNFQLVLREVPKNWWVYVFNINQMGEIGLYYSHQNNVQSIEKVIPSETNHFELEEEGTEWICVLYSKEVLPDFREALQNSAKANLLDIPTQTAAFFKENLSNSLIYNSNRMGFSLNKNNDVKVGLMILKVVVE
jgi:hypothetical protein